MEVQIASTLKVLTDSISDKKVQAHGLKFLVECGNSQLDESKIKHLPIIETVLLSIQQNNTVKTVLRLGCSVLIVYSRFSFCVEAAYQHKVIDYMCSQIVRLASESILSLDLAVIAAYGMTNFEKPEYIYDLLLDTLVSIESRWLENDAVLQQIITNYIVIAESVLTHPKLLQTMVISNIQFYLNKYILNEYIAFGLISTCKGLVLSEEGRSFLCSSNWCDLVLPIITKYPSNTELCSICLDILLKLNINSKSRKYLLQQNSLPLLITITNYCQKEESIIQQATQVIRSICSAEKESLELVIQHNTVSCLVMCLMSHPMSVPICTHGARALEWIAKAGDASVSKLLIDEGVIDLCIDIIENHDDLDLVSSTSFLLIKIIRTSNFDDYCISHICETTLFSVLKERIHQQEKNESIIVSYCNIIGILVSNKLCSSLLLDINICEIICQLLHSLILDSSVVLLTGILWKFSLLMEGRDQIYRCGGVDVLIGKIQLYPTQSTIQRNCCGCLLNLSNQYKEISEVLMSRLAVSLLIDSLQDNRKDHQLVLQLIPLLQNLFRDLKCKTFLLQHNIISHVLDALTEQKQNEVIVQVCLLFLNVIAHDKQGMSLVSQSVTVLPLLKEIQELYTSTNTNISVIAQGLSGKITKLKEVQF